MTLRELLLASTSRHRGRVAKALGLRGANAATIATALLDPERLARVVAGLPSPARAAATALAFGSPLAAGLAASPSAPLRELERHGLAFAFGQSWSCQYVVPDDLEQPLRRVRADAHAHLVPERDVRARNLVGAPMLVAHDVAAIWAALAREPARVKTEGPLYQRATTRLEAELPPVTGIDAEGFATMRVNLALTLLRDRSLVRLRVDDRPARESRRELVPGGDGAAFLDRPAPALEAEMRGFVVEHSDDLAWSLAEALAGRTLSVAKVGGAFRKLLQESGRQGGYASHHKDGTLALSALGPLWLAGAIQLGGSGERAANPSIVRFAPADVPDAQGPLGVCQSSFEVVCLRPPRPAERARLGLVAEAHREQAHVFTITAAAVKAGERQLGPGGVLRELAALVGEAPQNVTRSIASWARDVRPPLRLRTGLFLDAGDAASADALMAGPVGDHVVERLSERLLGLDGKDLAALERALASAGHELEPGLDRISGRWRELPAPTGNAASVWRARTPLPRRRMAPGRLISTLDEREPEPERPSSKRAQPAAGGVDWGLLSAAIARDSDVEIRYRGRRGTTLRRVTPIEIEGGTLHAWCHLRDDERSFWLSGIQEVALATD